MQTSYRHLLLIRSLAICALFVTLLGSVDILTQPNECTNKV
jgi:hypothetical protein